MDCEALLLSPVDAVCIFLDYISLTLFPQSCWHTLCPSNCFCPRTSSHWFVFWEFYFKISVYLFLSLKSVILPHNIYLFQWVSLLPKAISNLKRLALSFLFGKLLFLVKGSPLLNAKYWNLYTFNHFLPSLIITQISSNLIFHPIIQAETVLKLKRYFSSF